MVRTAVLAVAWIVLGVAPHPVSAQETKHDLKFQSAFPQPTYFFQAFAAWSARIEAMTGGRVKIRTLPPGNVVPAFEVLDATHKKVIDGAHSGAAYWVGKDKAATLFGPAPGGPFGMDIFDYMGWLNDGGGMELYRQLYQEVLKRDVVPIPMGPGTNQVLGWFKRPFKSIEDLKGRKCRQTGITGDVFARLGVSTVNLAGGEIVPAGQRGVIECAEWVGPAEDLAMGFHAVWKYYYMPSVHEPATVEEVLVNKEVWNGLSKDIQEIMLSAAWETTFRYQTIVNRANARALKELQEKHGVRVMRTPPALLQQILQAWDQIAAEESAKNPFFRKVLDSQREYAREVVLTRQRVEPPYGYAIRHYWSSGK
jgi:TRAP-type mannitol/chloroaromatic compound transport system substrate-binding protein